MSAAQAAAAALAHFYATMYCLMLLAKAGGGGQVARVAQVGQQELWPVISQLGGNQQTFTLWRVLRERDIQRFKVAGNRRSFIRRSDFEALRQPVPISRRDEQESKRVA